MVYFEDIEVDVSKLMIIDDDVHFRRSLAINLENRGFQVTEVKNSMDALKYLGETQHSEEAFEALIVDAKMPGLDGFWLADQASNKYPALKIIIMSAYTYPETDSKYTLLPKPVKISVLMNELNNPV